LTLLLPPLIQVQSSRDGSAICTADFTVVAVSPAGATPPPYALPVESCEQGETFGCPDVSDGAVPCTFALVSLASSAGVSYSVQVSSAGFQPTVVEVRGGGVSGCGGGPRSLPPLSVVLDPA
jgi:hypothetical protein